MVSGHLGLGPICRGWTVRVSSSLTWAQLARTAGRGLAVPSATCRVEPPHSMAASGCGFIQRGSLPLECEERKWKLPISDGLGQKWHIVALAVWSVTVRSQNLLRFQGRGHRPYLNGTLSQNLWPPGIASLPVTLAFLFPGWATSLLPGLCTYYSSTGILPVPIVTS